jgi:hypothetical protein
VQRDIFADAVFANRIAARPPNRKIDVVIGIAASPN